MNLRSAAVVGLALLVSGSCGGGGSGTSAGGFPSGAFQLVEVSNGFGTLLPYRIGIPDAAGATDPGKAPVAVTSFDVLRQNYTPSNGILPVVQWDTEPVLSTQAPGNHFVSVRFNQAIDVTTVLSDAVNAGAVNNLTANLEVVGLDPMTGVETPLSGRGFVGGRTFGSVDPMDATKRLLEEWVLLDGTGVALAPTIGAVQPGLGFPGSESVVPGISQLLSDATFVFVADTDGDLRTHETFPENVQIHTRFTAGVRNLRGRSVTVPGVAVSTVGPDTQPVELRIDPTTLVPTVFPLPDSTGVDPLTTIEIEFTKAVQLSSIGSFDDGTPPLLASAVLVQFGPALNRVSVPFSVRPRTIYDFTRVVLNPVIPFVADTAVSAGACSEFSRITVVAAAQQIIGIEDNAQVNTLGNQFSFQTGDGPALVNAVVLPDAVYVGRSGPTPSLSVVDLNGFGAGTGSPVFDDANPIIEGNTNFPNNPNVRSNGPTMVPVLERGSCTVDGGSRGVFTLVTDSALDTRLARSPLIESVADIAIGRALDNVFNNGLPFGCQNGGGNLCAQSGQLKTIAVAQTGTNSFPPPTGANLFIFKTVEGSENIMSWAPHPNPPPLVFPPTCFSPLIGGLEPTSVDTVPQNLLTPGASPFGDPESGLPPTGLLSREQNAFFQGPSRAAVNIGACSTYMIRQQIGQFMYVIDRTRAEVVVFNSNRFTVLDRIPLSDPTSFACSPNVDFLAVTNQTSDQVDFIDINPGSGTFHEVVETVKVGRGPTGIAWTPDNEDILVCNTVDNTVTILSAFNFEERKVIRNSIRAPLDLAITPRQTTFGRARNVYFAYILNGDGTVAVFESGPDGFNGWGFDDVIQVLPFRFTRAKAIQAEPGNFESQVWIVHENQLDPDTGFGTGLTGGAVTLVGIHSGAAGQQPLAGAAGGSPSARDLGWKVLSSIGSDQLTGVPVDIAFDNMVSTGALANLPNPFSAGPPALVNGKSLVKAGSFDAATMANAPTYIFVAVPDSPSGGVIDVIERPSNLRVDTNVFQAGVQSIPVPNVNLVADYYRQ